MNITSKPNRENTRRPKQGKGWCFSCDGARVGFGEKCPSCGKKDKRKNAPKRDYRPKESP